MQQLANSAFSTLNGAILSGATTLIVTSATPFPTSGDFTVLIGTELIKVTGVAGTTFTIVRAQESTVAAAHTNGVTVTWVLTKTAVEELIGDLYQQGVYSSRPASARKGTIYRSTNAGYSWQYNGTNWDLISPVFVPYAKSINIASWTALNHGTSVWTDVNGVINAKILSQSGPIIHGYTKSLPGATPYRLNLIIQPPSYRDAYYLLGLGMRQASSDKLKVYQIIGHNNVMYMNIENYNNVTSFAAQLLVRQFEPNTPIRLQIENDGTNWNYKFSLDGVGYTQFYTELVNNFVTPDQVVFHSNQNDANYISPHYTFLGYWED